MDRVHMLNTAKKAPSSPKKKTGHEIDLQGWDTANVVMVDVLNKAITTEGTTPKAFKNTYGAMAIDGKWGPWQIVPGGDGKLVHMLCPIKSGTGIDMQGNKKDLKGASVKIQLSLIDVPDPTKSFKDKTAKKKTRGKGAATAIVANTKSTSQDPAVVVITMEPASLNMPYQILFADWFNKNLNKFNQVFHAAMLNEKAAKKDFQWLKPTSVSYATVDTIDKKNPKTIFAALSQTDGDPDDKLAHQISPQIFRNKPDDCNSVLAISGEKFAEHILKTGAQHVMSGSKLSDFDIIGDGLVVTNNKELLWQKLEMDDGTVVSPMVPKNGLRMRVVEDQLELEFSGITFKHPLIVGNDIFTLNFTQYMNIELKRNQHKKWVLAPTNKTNANDPETPNMGPSNVSVKPDEDAQSFEKTMMIMSIALSILPFGCGVFKLGKWALVGTVAADAASAAAAGGDVISVSVDAADAAAMSENALAGTDNLAAAASLAADEPAAAGLSTLVNRFAMVSGFWAALSGIAFATISLQHNGDLKVDDSPTMDDFMDNVLGASEWPGAANWELRHAELAQSLLLYGQLDTGS